MKKYIFVVNALELMSRLYVGKRVEGVLYTDETGRLTFKAYNRTAPRHRKDRLERLKVFGSFPKELGTVQMLESFDEHAKEAMEAIAEEMAVGC